MTDTTTYPGAPRWVKVLGIIALAVVLLFATMMLAGGGMGNHGPARHLPSTSGASVEASPSGVTQAGDAGGHMPPGQTP